MVIFDGVKSDELLDFTRVCRSGYRTRNGDLGVKRTDMPFLASEFRSGNVNYPPLWHEKIL